MDDLTQITQDEFFNRVAARAPTPGGGSVAAVVGALSAALGRMVLAYSAGKGSGSDENESIAGAAAALSRLDQMLRALVTADAQAYEALTDAQKRAKETGDRSGLAPATMAAIGVPMEIAAAASELLAQLDAIKHLGNKHLLSDLGAAAVLADGAARAAQFMVRVNLSSIGDEARRAKLSQDIRQIVQHCTDRRESIEAFLSLRL